ncbi:unnamed protein product [Rotaria magnacalcarata]|uniref:Uncharacterized protein n=2 Tax=Rotaria magnacalcarata TaxID=392030 RepID=A0A819E4F8_9BILA|nr:unnamed protein product [Rotaria magnacalcarata]CAF3940271.1 unnamed protein product [Rotaria magnacalcarata]CAF4080207.1 unnamed protein product [Rotaria magnacalcarata]
MPLLLEHYEYEKVAALYIFQISVNRGGKEELATLILPIGSPIRTTSTNNDDKTFINEFSSATKLFHQPCVFELCLDSFLNTMEMIFNMNVFLQIFVLVQY